MSVFSGILLLFGFVLFSPFVEAAQTIPLVTSKAVAGGAQEYSMSMQALVLMTGLTLLPAILLMMTAFTRIIIVLSMLRQALGTMSAPPNMVMTGLALFLTFFVMSPVIDQIYNQAYKPFAEDKIDFMQAISTGSEPLKKFMMRQTRQEDLALFAKIADVPAMKGPEEVPLKILIPAYITSELKSAFQIAFVVFLPFLIIDMVVASILMAMGMMMLSPVTISLPFKIMLFVLVDGWNLILGSLVQSFYVN